MMMSMSRVNSLLKASVHYIVGPILEYLERICVSKESFMGDLKNIHRCSMKRHMKKTFDLLFIGFGK